MPAKIVKSESLHFGTYGFEHINLPNLTNEKIRLEADRDRWKKRYEELEARFNTLQDMHWKLQDRFMKIQATLVNEIGVRNFRDYGEHPM